MPLNQTSFLFDEPAPSEPVQGGDKKLPASPPREKKNAKPVTGSKKIARGRMSLQDMEAGAGLVNIPEDEVLFSKSYYSISVVAEMFNVNQSLIRFWENEFDILKPKKNGKGDRLFRPEDIRNLKLIYHLLRERKYTIGGAKDFLKKNNNAEEKFAMIESLKKLKGFLLELKANL
jgi:DNA-binding transcriptional MerR regulator